MTNLPQQEMLATFKAGYSWLKSNSRRDLDSGDMTVLRLASVASLGHTLLFY